MADNSMVEKVARAISPAWFGEAHMGLENYDGQAKNYQDSARCKARAALEACHFGELVEALTLVESGHEYKTPAGTINCRFCDHCMDHEGTFEDMHAPDCLIHGIRAVLAKVEASDA